MAEIKTLKVQLEMTSDFKKELKEFIIDIMKENISKILSEDYNKDGPIRAMLRGLR